MRTFVVLVASALALAVALTASADPSGNPPLRDHGHGHWFKHGCSWQGGLYASCNVNVVTDSAGKPLASSTPPATALAPTQFHSAYALPTAGGAGQTIAIVDAYDDPTAESDLATFSSQFGLPTCTTANGCFRKVNQSGGTSYPGASSGWSLEIALDVETAHGICPSCKILLVEATNNAFTNLFAAENEAVALGANVISNSWGGNESSSETSFDSAFNHPGVAITASTGDNGYGVEYPAASRYVTAVGGTTLHLTADGSWSSETAWSDAGSGCSSYEAKPGWQTDTGCSHRALADVSADADPNTGAAIYVSSYSAQGWYQVGGTSLAAPLIASAYALTGTAASAVYGSTPYAHTTSLHDITSGSNGSCGSYLCNAVAGFDGPTGLGTPIGLAAFTAGSGGGGGGGTQTGDYTLGVSPSSATVTAGGATGYTATVTPSDDFTSSVSLSVASGLPAGATATFSPSSLTSGNSTLNVQTSSNTPTGTYTLTISGSGGGTTHTTTVSLSVQAASANPDFTLSVSPSSGSISRFGSTTFTVTITRTGGFSSPVTLSASGFSLGTKGSFSPDPATTTSTLTVTAGLRIGQGTSTLTITGTGGGKTHTTTVALTVS